MDNSLRPYQQQAKEDIFSAWDECDGVMFQMPTGTGKTRLFSSIISDIKTWSVQNSEDVKILIIAHRIELIDQISENLERYKVSHGIIAGGKPRDLRYPVQVASVQTITHRNNHPANHFGSAYLVRKSAHSQHHWTNHGRYSDWPVWVWVGGPHRNHQLVGAVGSVVLVIVSST